MDLGAPISYKVLEAGVPVLDSESLQIGDVAHVLVDEQADVFDGIVISGAGDLNGHRFVDADQVEAIYAGGVVLKLDHQTALELPEPSANPAVVQHDPADPAATPLAAKLRRAWDYISGNY